MTRDRKPMIIETMTLGEVVDAMRGAGMRTSETRVALMLEAGKYPWGIAVRGEKNMLIEIYAKKFWEWVDEMGEEDTDYIQAQKNSPAAATTGLIPA